MITILLLFNYIHAIKVGQKNFIEIFNENTLTPDNFTIKVKGMPDEALYFEGN